MKLGGWALLVLMQAHGVGALVHPKTYSGRESLQDDSVTTLSLDEERRQTFDSLPFISGVAVSKDGQRVAAWSRQQAGVIWGDFSAPAFVGRNEIIAPVNAEVVGGSLQVLDAEIPGIAAFDEAGTILHVDTLRENYANIRSTDLCRVAGIRRRCTRQDGSGRTGTRTF